MRARVVARIATGLAATLLAAAALATAACSPATAPKPATPTLPPATAPSSSATSAAPAPGGAGAGTPLKPGTTKLPGGTSSVVGTLQFRDIEGGIWVVVDATPGQATDQTRVLAVIADPELFDLTALKGAYVKAVGTIAPGAVTANMAGPQLTANTITPVTGQ